MHGGGPVLLIIQIELLDCPRHQPALVVRVIDHKARIKAKHRRLSAQNARADGVKGADGQTLAFWADQRAQPRDHLSGGFVRKGHRHDAIGRHALFGHEVGHPVGEHTRLARAGPGQHEHGTVRRADRLRLCTIQPFKKTQTVSPSASVYCACSSSTMLAWRRASVKGLGPAAAYCRPSLAMLYSPQFVDRNP